MAYPLFYGSTDFIEFTISRMSSLSNRNADNTRSVIVTKGGHPRGSGLYRTSRTIGQGVAESRNYIRTKRTNVLTYLYIKRTDIPTYSTITMGRSYIFKYTVPTVK